MLEFTDGLVVIMATLERWRGDMAQKLVSDRLSPALILQPVRSDADVSKNGEA